MADTVDNPHVGDVGTVLNVRVRDENGVIVNLATATALFIFLRKPKVYRESSGIVVQKTAVLKTDGTDGWMKYTTVSGDFDVSGVWQIQGEVQITGTEFRTRVGSFAVDEIL